MNRILLTIITIVLLAVAIPATDSTVAIADSPVAVATGSITIKIDVLVDSKPVPVANTAFTITGSGGSQTVRTDETGAIHAALPPGDYVLASVAPYTFMDNTLTWTKSFSVALGAVSEIDLSDLDATLGNTAPSPAPDADAGKQAKTDKHPAWKTGEDNSADTDSKSDSGAPATTHVSRTARSAEALVYDKVQSGVVLVEGNDGTGTGFIVDKSGLVVTNEHVIHGGDFAALRFAPGIRVDAKIAASFENNDVAVLKFDPSLVKSFAVIPLADPTKGEPAQVGDRVLTIGCPIGEDKTFTKGVISRFDGDVIVCSIPTSHGNSGGPLLNLNGEALGITTLVYSKEIGGSLSGAIKIRLSVPIVEEARSYTGPAPYPALLPDIPPIAVPADELNAASAQKLNPVKLIAPKDFDGLIFTPFIISSLNSGKHQQASEAKNQRVKQRRGNSVQSLDEPNELRFYDRLIHDKHDATEAAVTVEISPKKLQTWKSKYWGYATIPAGEPNPVRQFRFEFRDDFYDMKLLRGDQEIVPMRRVRVSHEVNISNPDELMQDKAFGGEYEFDPAAFAPGAKLTIKMRRESNLDQWDNCDIPEKVRDEVWKQFAPYRAYVASITPATAQ